MPKRGPQVLLPLLYSPGEATDPSEGWEPKSPEALILSTEVRRSLDIYNSIETVKRVSRMYRPATVAIIGC